MNSNDNGLVWCDSKIINKLSGGGSSMKEYQFQYIFILFLIDPSFIYIRDMKVKAMLDIKPMKNHSVLYAHNINQVQKPSITLHGGGIVPNIY